MASSVTEAQSDDKGICIGVENSVLARRRGQKGTFTGWHSQHYAYAIQHL